jgi:hypothetical protein
MNMDVSPLKGGGRDPQKGGNQPLLTNQKKIYIILFNQ